MLSIPKATIANKQSSCSINNFYKELIESKVKEAIERGVYYTIIEHPIEKVPEEMINDLKKKGYKIAHFANKLWIRW